MVGINSSLVKELREKTGAGMMDCKKALVETDGDIEAAVDWLRKNGLSAAAKKAGRVTADGLVGVMVSDCQGAVVEINAETDFVARNGRFQAFVCRVAEIACANLISGEEAIRAAAFDTTRTVEDELTDMIATIGENITLRRLAVLSVGSGVVSGYVHNALSPGVGTIGVLVALESDADKAVLDSFGRQLAMHIAAASPQSKTIEEVSPVSLEREKNVLMEQARASGTKEEIVAKMVNGRIQKYYEETVLLEQVYVLDGKIRVKDILAAKAKELKSPVSISGFVRFQLGEGIERPVSDFVSEVAAQAKL